MWPATQDFTKSSSFRKEKLAVLKFLLVDIERSTVFNFDGLGCLFTVGTVSEVNSSTDCLAYVRMSTFHPPGVFSSCIEQKLFKELIVSIWCHSVTARDLTYSNVRVPAYLTDSEAR